MKRLLPQAALPQSSKREGPQLQRLLFQRLFWGAAAGGLATILFAESPVLDTMEMNLLEWRYKCGYELSKAFLPLRGPSMERSRAEDIALITYDDEDQFDLESESEEGGAAPIQSVLARLIPVIEAGQPLLIVMDLDLRGKADPNLVSVLRRYRNNVILALSGALDNPNDFPAAELRKSVLKCAFDHVLEEQNGLTCRMPIAANMYSEANREIGSNTGSDYDFAALNKIRGSWPGNPETIESLPEVVAPIISSRLGIGPSRLQITDYPPEELPVYIKFSGVQYPTFKARDVLSEVDPHIFAGKVVMIGTNFSQKVDNTPRVRTPLSHRVPNVYIQAEAISTLSKNEAIRSFPPSILHHLLLLVGAFLGSLASALPMGRRTAAFLCTAMFLVVLTQVAFQWLNLHFPILPLLAVLMLTYIFGTLIYLDTDLRLRNKELAIAREAMQVRAEEERQRIAEDLHDETLPALSSVARMADKLAHDMTDHPTPKEMREKLDGAISEMRRVINDLHPSVLETMGFKPALENLLVMLEREKNVHVDFVDGDGQDDYGFNDFTRLQLYRIVQESINNIQKHSQANQVKLVIKADEGALKIIIEDNGKGIDFSQIKKDSHGLVNIRQRAQLIGAQVEWKKPEDFASGTQVSLKIPILKEGKA